MSKNDKKYFYKTLAMSNDINRGEGGMDLNINVLAPLPWERGWGEVKEREGDARG